MKQSTHRGTSLLFRLGLLFSVLMLVALGSGLAAPVVKEAIPSIVVKCQADLAQRIKPPGAEITVIEAQATTWPDAALGMPENDKMYAQVLTPGWRIILEARNTRYLYVASATAFKYGGPLALWSYSMLYLLPVADEANLNGDLYQCSMLGTNSTRIVSGATAYYPQKDGGVIIKRRTSRSGHDLLYVKADKANKTTMLGSAFDFGDAAMNSAEVGWAAFIRSTLGATWNIGISHIRQVDAKLQTLPLPDGVQPGRIAWLGDKLVILVKKGENTVGYEIAPNATKPEWKAVAANTFPGLPSYSLNKSEMLDISAVKTDGKPGVEVAKVWFTGDRNIVATISGLTLQGQEFLGKRYAVVWGEQDGKQASYTVDIATGEVISGIHGAIQEIKPFIFPSITGPYRPASAGKPK